MVLEMTILEMIISGMMALETMVLEMVVSVVSMPSISLLMPDTPALRQMSEPAPSCKKQFRCFSLPPPAVTDLFGPRPSASDNTPSVQMNTDTLTPPVTPAKASTASDVSSPSASDYAASDYTPSVQMNTGPLTPPVTPEKARTACLDATPSKIGKMLKTHAAAHVPQTPTRGLDSWMDEDKVRDDYERLLVKKKKTVDEKNI